MALSLIMPLLLQGTSSNILVRLSNVYSLLRGDQSGVKNEDSAQVCSRCKPSQSSPESFRAQHVFTARHAHSGPV